MGTCFTRQAGAVNIDLEKNKLRLTNDLAKNKLRLEQLTVALKHTQHMARLEHVYRILSEYNMDAYLSQNERDRLRSATEPVQVSADAAQVRFITYTVSLPHLFPVSKNVLDSRYNDPAGSRFKLRVGLQVYQTAEDCIHLQGELFDEALTRTQALETLRPSRSTLERVVHLQGEQWGRGEEKRRRTRK
jgi:hypothetical protein